MNIAYVIANATARGAERGRRARRRRAVITISWNPASRNLHVNSFYLELPEVVSA